MLVQLVAQFMERQADLGKADVALMSEPSFQRHFASLIKSQANEDLSQARTLVENRLRAIYLRFRQMKRLNLEETVTEPRIFYRLLQELMKDEFKTFDLNLNRRRVRFKIHRNSGRVIRRITKKGQAGA